MRTTQIWKAESLDSGTEEMCDWNSLALGKGIICGETELNLMLREYVVKHNKISKI